jgi:hypothetical protein
MRARIDFRTLAPGEALSIGDATVRTAPARHPNGCLAYRIDHAGRSVVYATDTEHDPVGGRIDANLLALARGADLLIYDAQYTPDEYSGAAGGGAKVGWGHSTAQEGARQARDGWCSSTTIRRTTIGRSPASRPTPAPSSRRRSRRAKGWSSRSTVMRRSEAPRDRRNRNRNRSRSRNRNRNRNRSRSRSRSCAKYGAISGN